MRDWLYKLKWRLHHPQAFAAWGHVVANECLSIDELHAIQENARRRIVRHAVENTVFYSRHYGNVDFNIADIGGDGWFEKLPIVTKCDLRAYFDEFVNKSGRKHLRVSTTGGSTGIPTKTGYDDRVPEEVYSWRLQNWFDVHPWDDHAYVWRDTSSGIMAKSKNAALWWPTRHLKMDATFMTAEGMLNFIRKYNHLKPAMLQGYVGAIAQLAQFVVDNRMSVHSPRFVWTTSAPLPDSQRNLIVKAFNAPVCDQYGSCEVRWIAQQCPQCGGLHVNVEHVHIEFVDDKNIPGESGVYGKTLLTNLEDTVFPLIRYENGDRGRWLDETCSCGRTLPMIDSVKGRESEHFVLPSGKIINGEFLTTLFDDAPELVYGFRVVQHKDLSITIEYIPAKTESEVLKHLEKFSSRISDEVPIECKRVDHIAHDAGKLRFVVKENK